MNCFDLLKYEEITGDLFDIVGRLKEIDPTYFVLRERKSGRLQLHSAGQKGSTFCASIPYETLDERTLCFARRTRRERADELIAEMEKENEQLQKRQQKAAINAALKVSEKGGKICSSRT